MDSTPRPTIESVTAQLTELVPEDARLDLATEDPPTALAVHFPTIGLKSLPRRDLVADECSTDGYYDPFIDPTHPWIFYADDVAPPRIRFTLLHELGHHLFNSSGAALLDDLDRIGGSPDRAAHAEEATCHQFASELLLPTQLVDQVLPTSGPIRPEHVHQLHEQSPSVSLDAVAVRIVARLHAPGAVVIMRDDTTIAFCAARPRGQLVAAQIPGRSSWGPRPRPPTTANGPPRHLPMATRATRDKCTATPSRYTTDSPSRSSPPSPATAASTSSRKSNLHGRHANTGANGATSNAPQAGANAAMAPTAPNAGTVDATNQDATRSAQNADFNSRSGREPPCAVIANETEVSSDHSQDRTVRRPWPVVPRHTTTH